MTDVERNAILGNVQRQYVGARYVPKFFQGPDGTPTWVGNVPYESLTIVTYLGNSYTSKVPVPAGIGNPSQNPTYWALTGNYNAQLDELIQQYNELNETYSQLKIYVTPQMFGAKGDGITDDTSAIQNAISAAKGGHIHFPAGDYLISNSLTLYPLTEYSGDGIKITRITLKASSNTTVFKSNGYDSYRQNGYPKINNTDNPSSFFNNPGSSFCSIHDLTIDGGYYSRSGVIQNTSGNGITFIGSSPTLQNIEIQNCPNVGMLIDTFNFNENWLSQLSYDLHLQGFFNRIEIHHCGNEGWIEKGLQDPQANNIRIYKCLLKGNVSAEGYKTPGALIIDSLYPSRGSMSFGVMHIHNIEASWGMVVYGPARLEHTWLMVENCLNGINCVSANTYGAIDKLDLHNISNTPLITNGAYNINFIDVYNCATNKTLLELKGPTIIGDGKIVANELSGPAIGGGAFFCSVKLQLLNFNDSPIIDNELVFSRGVFNLMLSGCNVLFSEAAKKFFSSKINLTINATSFDISGFNDLTYANSVSIVMGTMSTAFKYPSTNRRSYNINFNTTDEQTITVNSQNYFTGMDKTNISIVANTDANLDYIYISEFTSSSLTFKLKLQNAGGSFFNYITQTV